MCLDLCRLSCSNYEVQFVRLKEIFKKEKKIHRKKKVVLTASRNRPYGALVGPREIALYQLSSRVVS